MSPIEKYLRLYAEPESQEAHRLSGRYAAALVVPVLAESIDLLEGYRSAARAASARVLVILVVNRALGRPLHSENARLLEALDAIDPGREPLWPGARQIRASDFDLLVIDRSSPGRELPVKQGVGLARKIGLDVALALHVLGRVDSPWLCSTDADARLPAGYFESLASGSSSSSALLYPFRHVGAPDAITDATLLYEASLRYRVLGLAWAGSPYAYHSVGSTLAVRADKYAGVRGVPKREAGEDFYLLDKLGKVAPLERLGGDPIEIRARRSKRVPFGTGPRVARMILDEEALRVPDPHAFAVLQSVLSWLGRFATTLDERSLQSSLWTPPGIQAVAVERTLEGFGFFEACREAASAVGSGNLRRRLFTWFDALRTVRFMNALEDAGLAPLPALQALEEAPFVASSESKLEAPIARLCRLEAALPAFAGPSAMD